MLQHVLPTSRHSFQGVGVLLGWNLCITCTADGTAAPGGCLLPGSLQATADERESGAHHIKQKTRLLKPFKVCAPGTWPSALHQQHVVHNCQQTTHQQPGLQSVTVAPWFATLRVPGRNIDCIYCVVRSLAILLKMLLSLQRLQNFNDALSSVWLALQMRLMC